VKSTNYRKNGQHGKKEKTDGDEIHHSAEQLETFEPIEMDTADPKLATADFAHDSITFPGDLPRAK
jgi:hypothetical protein